MIQVEPLGTTYAEHDFRTGDHSYPVYRYDDRVATALTSLGWNVPSVGAGWTIFQQHNGPTFLGAVVVVLDDDGRVIYRGWHGTVYIGVAVHRHVVRDGTLPEYLYWQVLRSADGGDYVPVSSAPNRGAAIERMRIIASAEAAWSLPPEQIGGRVMPAAPRWHEDEAGATVGAVEYRVGFHLS